MIKLAPLVLKTLWRHRTRTLLTVSGTAVGLFVFCLIGSIQEGLEGLFERREARQALIVFQAHKFCPATSRLPQDYRETILAVPGVREVVPIQVFTNNCRASLDVVVFHGLPPEMLGEARDFTIVDGSLAEFERHQDAALVGRAVARRKGIRIGDKFTLGDYTVTVAGRFACEADPAEENTIYTHLEFLQRGRGSGGVGTVTQLEVLLAPGADPEQVSRAIDAALGGGPVETETRPKGLFQAKTLADLTHLLGLTRYLALACLGVVLMLVSTTTVMAVQDRVREHAVLHTLGFSTRRIFLLVLAESTLLGTLGGVLGAAAATAVLAASDLAIGAEAVTIAFLPSLESALLATGLGVAVGTAAGIVPAWTAATADVVGGLR